jgi:hypothetical protein
MDSHQLFLNCRQRKKLNLQRFQYLKKRKKNKKRKERKKAKPGSRRRNSDMDTKIKF